MAHTPGPWDCDGTEVYAEHLPICTAYRARLDDEGNYMPNAEVDANARLIAAAPELAAALRAIVVCAHMESPVGGKAYFISELRMNAARSALAKAEGERVI